MSVSIKMKVHFALGNHNHRLLRKGKPPKYSKSTRLPRITRLMALSVKYEQLLAKGLVKSHRELADLAGVERSQISTILRFRLLAPHIQEWLLNLPESEKGSDPVGMIDLRAIATHVSWEKQCEQLHQLIPELYPISAPEASTLPKAHNPKQ
jgi:hypothetical protein